MDREGTIKAFSELDSVTDLVFAVYTEKPTTAETVEPNARMLNWPGCGRCGSFLEREAAARHSAKTNTHQSH
jgi:hypothetical protein